MDTKETNKLIAEFMGGKIENIHPHGDNQIAWTGCSAVEWMLKHDMLLNASIKLEDLKFHTSWEWFIPAFNKAKQLIKANIKDNRIDNFGKLRIILAGEYILDGNIKDAYSNLVSAIEWYNKINEKESI